MLVLAAVAATASAAQMRGATNRVRTNSGPVLVATQQLVSSLAEADAAQTAAFLSGRDEDPEQRRLYEQALARAEQQMEQIAARVGDDQAVHDLLQRVSVRVSTYAGLVEAARASNKAGVPEAAGYLVDSVRLGNAIVQDDLTALTAATQERLGQDEDRRSQGWIIALAVVVAGLAVLGFGQAHLTRASRRIVNLPLAVGTLALLAVLVWLVVAQQGSGKAIRDARRQGYDSIALTAQLQTAGFGAKAAETLALVTGDANQRADADARSALVAAAPVTPDVVERIRSGTVATAPPAASSARPRPTRPPPGPGPRWPRSPSAGSATATRWPRCGRPRRQPRPGPSPWAARTPSSTGSTSRWRPSSARAGASSSPAWRRRPTARPASRPRPCSSSSAPWWPPCGGSSCVSTTTGEAP